MIRLSEIRLPLDAPENALHAASAAALGVPAAALVCVNVYKRSIDARKKHLQQVFIVDVQLADTTQEAALLARHAGHPHIRSTPDMAYRPVAHAPAPLPMRPVVVGFGPCGMLAALVLAQMGFKPIVIERGKKVRERTQDTWALWRKRVLTSESNVQFGEGGAGTFSDGKLYSQIKDPRHLGRKVMEEFVQAGAPEDILYVARPHIGTFRLVKVVENIRQQIEALGGEVRFQQRVVDVIAEDQLPARRVLQAEKALQGLKIHDTSNASTYELPTQHAIFALGHSARDTFTMLYERGVAMQAKPFSIGFRIEHPQSLIDRARWGQHAGHPLLGAADYKLVHHARNGRAVYSFCMCPGGTVVAATSEIGRVVTNGMSQYSRNERNANAGLVVGITPADFPALDFSLPAAQALALAEALPMSALERHADPLGPVQTANGGSALLPSPACGRGAGGEGLPPTSATPTHPLAGIALQRILESHAYVLGGSNYNAPAQTVGDFLAQRPSSALGEVAPSYKPGIALTDLTHALPTYATTAMREALPAFGKKIRGFDWGDALLTGVETRTSSPLRIDRDRDTLQSPSIHGLYPAGEGAGYAGGILSAAVDGIEVAEALARAMVAAHSA